MRAYWIAALITAAAIGAWVLEHRSRPFSEEETIAFWEGHAPDPGTTEYIAALERAEGRARIRQAGAPRDAAIAFFLVLTAAGVFKVPALVRNRNSPDKRKLRA